MDLIDRISDISSKVGKQVEHNRAEEDEKNVLIV